MVMMMFETIMMMMLNDDMVGMMTTPRGDLRRIYDTV